MAMEAEELSIAIPQFSQPMWMDRTRQPHNSSARRAGVWRHDSGVALCPDGRRRARPDYCRVSRPTQRLLQAELLGCTILSSGEPIPEFDVQCPLLSLPMIFGTTLADIPAKVPYLRSDPQLASKWRNRLAGFTESMKVGLVWAGNPAFRNDKIRSPRELSLLSPLAEVKNVQFFSLQKGDAANQTRKPPAGMQLTDWSSELHDFCRGPRR